MKAENINAVATSTIAFVTILGLMVGFYFNLQSAGIRIIYIVVFELLFVIAIVLFIIWVNGKSDII